MEGVEDETGEGRGVKDVFCGDRPCVFPVYSPEGLQEYDDEGEGVDTNAG